METSKIDLEKLKKDTWTDQEYENAEVVMDFIQNIMIDHNFDYIKEKYGSHKVQAA